MSKELEEEGLPPASDLHQAPPDPAAETPG
jgi:hypothetical protein